MHERILLVQQLTQVDDAIPCFLSAAGFFRIAATGIDFFPSKGRGRGEITCVLWQCRKVRQRSSIRFQLEQSGRFTIPYGGISSTPRAKGHLG